MTSFDPRWLLTVVLLAEVLGFAAFVWDKLLARGGYRRIPERQLLTFVLIGGIGAWIGAHLVRHKTRKEPFRTWMRVVLMLHIGLFLAAALVVILRL
ncbi:DUF1294 domain-containing protein [Brevundimonas nasdae]|uniref:DUF1294 domain-containing protein n=1 Tax=Brevundimonas nasdae TaxID=172043 RepID=A0ABX8TI78_9CAUL|nr:DUF1294 domain-containing protein [Brevundimonas nasdae]QYC10497.1 DUF1294 domain-containing protein [Brevundimonas nasdae]QYC13284.1 DUF1294 domain-containing protein [Brevundimonas nasdae]